MKKTLFKDTLRSIAANRLRFISIIVIVALGISFFIGIKSSSPAMGYSANEYFRINNLLDLRVTSQIPFTDEDIEKIENIKKVDYVVRSRYIDAVVSVGNSTLVDASGTELTCRISSLNIEQAKKFTQTGTADDSYVNRVVLKDGRYPEKPGECLVDAVAVNKYESLGIGSVIKLSAKDSAVSDALKVQELKIVGTVDSPMYISNERGTTQVGSGSLSSFVFVDESVFRTNEINELFIKINYDDIYDKFSEEYASIVNKIAEEIKLVSSDSIGSKLSDLKIEYNTKIQDKQTEIDEYKASSAVELKEKQTEIDEFKAYVDSEDEILAQKKEQNESEKASLKSTLDSVTGRYNSLKTEHEKNVKEFESSSSEIKGYTEQKKLYEEVYAKYVQEQQKVADREGDVDIAKADVVTKRTALDTIKSKIDWRNLQITNLNNDILKLSDEINTLRGELSVLENKTVPDLKKEISALETKISDLENKDSLTDYETALLIGYSNDLRTKENQLKSAESKVTDYNNKINEKTNAIKDKNNTVTTLKNDNKTDEASRAKAEAEWNAANETYENALESYNDAKADCESTLKILENHKAALDKLTSGQTKLVELSETIEAQKKELDSLSIAVTQAQIRYSLKARNSSREIQKAQYDLDNAKTRYHTIDNELDALKTEIENQKAALDQDLKKLKNTLNNIDSITWQTTTQQQLAGHIAFKKSMDNILSMSNIFPIIFFVTAMIACFVIMMKNVEESRGTIGLFKAFGYSGFTILGKFSLYSVLAWLGGAFIGGVLGTCVVPPLVYSIYDIVYTVPNVGARFDLKYIVIGLGVSFATTMVATFVAAFRELKMYPAALMRPKMIGYNRRSLLERLPDFWGRLPYGIVLLIRTVIRSRKRVAVGSIAIACCTALILSSLGLFNSVTDVSESQYGKDGIFNYDVQFVLNANQNPNESAVLKNVMEDESVTAAMLISNISMTLSPDEKQTASESVHVVTPSNTEDLTSYINLEVVEGSADISGGGAVLSQKIAENMGVSTGDRIYLKDSDDIVHSIKVIGVVKNYIDHYAYISQKTYEEVFFEAPEYKYLVCTLKDYLTDEEISDFAAEYLQTEDVAGATTSQMMSRTADTAINQVMILVVIFVLSACLLAMIVMYTTSNVNISERTHEIANIKVIGFSDGEVLLYVIRENIISTVIGIYIGLVAGIFLHNALVNLISVENVMYGSTISWWSFFATAGIIIAVAILAALPILFKINRVKMAETLKSVE